MRADRGVSPQALAGMTAGTNREGQTVSQPTGIGAWGSKRRQTILTVVCLVAAAILVVLGVVTFSSDRSRATYMFVIVGVGLLILAGGWVFSSRQGRS